MINKKILWGGLTALLILILTITSTSKEKSETNDAQPSSAKKVFTTNSQKESNNTVMVSELTSTKKPLLLYGKTVSESQVDVYAQVPAKITQVNFSLGDHVKAGDIVVTLESQDEQNSLTQAYLNLKSARLGLTKLLAGSRDEEILSAETTVSTNEKNLAQTISDIEKNIEDLDILLEAILRKDIDDFFDHTDKNKNIYLPTFTYLLQSEEAETELVQTRIDLEESFDNYQANTSTQTTAEAAEAALAILEDFSDFTELLYLNSKDFLGFSESAGEEIEAKTLSIKETIDGYEEKLENLVVTLVSNSSTLNLSENSLNLLEAGASTEDIDVSQSSIDLAQNTVRAAEIALSKKVLVAPIDGKISSISAKTGRFASSAQPIFSIENPDNLKVESSISPSDAVHITLNKEVMVEGAEGRISAISPVINESTGSLDFEATFSSTNTSMFSGRIVDILIPQQLQDAKTLSLPLSAVFEKQGSYFVFVLNEQRKATQKQIDILNISGDFFIVADTFASDDILIINARGLSEGDTL